MAQDLYYRIYAEAVKKGIDLSSAATSLTVDETGNEPDQLTLQVSDPYKTYSHALREGVEVEVDLGWADDHSVVFRGVVCKVDGAFPQDSVPSLRVLARDRSILLGLRRRSRAWTNITLSNIVYKIAKEVFLMADIQVHLKGEPTFSGNGVRQHDMTDLAFLRRLATDYGCELFVVAGEHADELHFEAQAHLMEKEPAVTLAYGRCGARNRLLSFQASSDVTRVQLARTFSGIDFATGQALAVKTAPVQPVAVQEDEYRDENLAAFFKEEPIAAAEVTPLMEAAGAAYDALRRRLGSSARVATPGFTTAQDLQVRADNQFSTSLYGMRASGSAVGNHRLHAQATVEIADVGGFSNIWYLARVRHILDRQGYRVEFECQR